MLSSLRISLAKVPRRGITYHSRAKEANMLQKMLKRNSGKRKNIGYTPKVLSKATLFSAFDNDGGSQRQITLNKIYLENITQILASGKCSSQLSDLGIEIVKVKLASGLNFLNIYWITRKPDVPEEVINISLKNALGEVQEQIGNLRFMSRVPLAKFVKDLRLERELQLDKLFKLADLGKDKVTEEKKVVMTPENPEKLPKMAQTLLDLDYAKISSRITAALSRFKAINFDTNQSEQKGEMPEKLIPFDKKAFFKFYKRHRILVLKMKKRAHPCEYEEGHEDSFDPFV